MSRVRELPRFSAPGHCIMFPGRRRDERGFYLFDTILDGVHGDIQVGISSEGLRTIADRHGAEFGIARREDLDDATAAVHSLREEVRELQERIEELEEFKEHLAGVAAQGFDIKRRQGRPAKKDE